MEELGWSVLELQGVDDGREGDRPFSGTMADEFASADPGADAPAKRERERWCAILLLAQGLTAAATAEALERDPHTIGRWAAFRGSLQPGYSSRPVVPPRLTRRGRRMKSARTARRGGHRIGQLVLEGLVRQSQNGLASACAAELPAAPAGVCLQQEASG